MDNLEKVEMLRERANVSYEEAARALEENDWDLLAAIVALEKNGKVHDSGKDTSPEENVQKEEQASAKKEEKASAKEDACDKEINKKAKKEHKGGTIGQMIKKFYRICRDNSFCIKRNEEEVLKVPVIILVLVALCTWKYLLPLMIIGLFFNLRYSFEGKDDLKEANALMNKAGEAAEKVREKVKEAEGGEAEMTTGSDQI